MNNNNTYCQGNKERNKGGKEKTKQYCEKKNSSKSTPKININNYLMKKRIRKENVEEINAKIR